MSTKPPEQSKVLGCLARLVALPLALLLVLALPLGLLAFDVWRVVFNPPLVKALLADEVVHSDLLPIALAWFSERRAQERVANGEALSGIDEPDIVLLLSYLDRNDWRAIKTEVLTDEFLTHLVSVTVDGVYAWIDSADRVPQITWDLAPFVDQVNSDHGEQAITIAYARLPPCTPDEIADYQARLAAVPPGTEVLYNLCQFPDPWHADQFGDYVHALRQVVGNIPVQFALTEELSRGADQGGVDPETIKQELRWIRLLAMWSGAVPVVLLIAVVALAVRSLRSMGPWVGLPFLAGGLLALLAALVYSPIITNLLASGPLSEAPPLIMAEAARVTLRLAGEIFTPLLIQAAIVVVIGIGLLAWYLLRRRAAAPAPAPAGKAAKEPPAP